MTTVRLDSCSEEAERCNTAKKPKIVEIDRISGLSDDLIALILSFLSTKDAVATSILSKRWRSLWAMVPVLNFSSSSSNETRSFLRFFRKRVKTLEGPLAVVRLQGKFGPYFGDWVCKAIACGVRELDISITGAKPIKIFRHGSLTSKTLVSLRLEKVFFDVPLSVHLPYLKILHLKEVGDVSEESLSRFIIGCPVVEYVLLSKYSQRQSLKLPLGLFTSQTLVSLNLGYGVSLDLPYSIHLPCLKILKLDRQKYMNHKFISQFLSGCTLLEELSLWMADGKLLKLPEHLFFSKTLVSLKLWGSISLHVPPSICLPSLRILHLGGSTFVLENLLGDLLSGCPVLEEIYLGSLPITNEESSSMCVPSLERLMVCLRSKHHPLALNLKITAPALKHFRILCGLSYGEIAWNFPNLQEASVSIEQNIPRKLFGTIKNTKVLKLQHCCFGGISTPLDVNLIPEFPHLEHLEIENPVSLVFLLPEILENSDNLQKLIIFDKKASHDVIWYTPRNVPHCLLHSLKEFSVDCFEGLNKEMQMVNYILTNAHVLEEIRVGFFALDADQKFRAQEKLSAIPRSSRMSRLEFI